MQGLYVGGLGNVMCGEALVWKHDALIRVRWASVVDRRAESWIEWRNSPITGRG
jgi:hypothetical protein